MNYVNYVDRTTGEIYSYDVDDEAQVAAIKFGLDPLSDEELSQIRAAQAAANAPTEEQILKGAHAKRDNLLSLAALRIAPLQDAVDLDVATPDDIANLKLWKQYRLDVSRTPSQEGFPLTIEWPAEPL